MNPPMPAAREGGRARPRLLVEALSIANDSGLGKLARMYVDALGVLQDVAEIHLILPFESKWRPGYACVVHRERAKPLRVWVQLWFPLLITKVRPQAVLCLGQTLPSWRPRAKYILSIPDIGPVERMGLEMSSHEAYNRRWLSRMPGKADLILTISKTMRGRMRDLLGLPESKIRVVSPIASGTANESKGVPSLHNANLPQQPYFLALGNVEPRKNYPGLIKAYAELKRRRPDTPHLHIVGHKAWGYAVAAQTVVDYGVSENVHFTDYLDDGTRDAWIRHCEVFISSSLYEGWGFPLFEALTAGRPCIYHSGTSQDEFAHGFALGTDCGNPESLADAMETMAFSEATRKQFSSAARTGFLEILKYDLPAELSGALRPHLFG